MSDALSADAMALSITPSNAPAPAPASDAEPPAADLADAKAEPAADEAEAADALAAEAEAKAVADAKYAASRADLERLAAVQRERLMEKRRLRSQSDALSRERQGFEADRKEAVRLRDEIAAAKAREDSWRKDPLAFAEESGMSPEKLVGAVVKRGTPEAAIETLRAELAAERAARADYEKKLGERFEAEQAAKAEAEERAQRQQIEQTQIRAADSFVAMCTSSEADYPTLAALAEVAPHIVIAEARQVALGVLRWNRENPDRAEMYTDQEIAAHIEQRLKPVYHKLAGGKVAAQVASQGPGSVVSAGSAKQAPKTLSNASQADRSGQELDLAKMNRQEQTQALVLVYDKSVAARAGAKPAR